MVLTPTPTNHLFYDNLYNLLHILPTLILTNNQPPPMTILFYALQRPGGVLVGTVWPVNYDPTYEINLAPGCQCRNSDALFWWYPYGSRWISSANAYIRPVYMSPITRRWCLYAENYGCRSVDWDGDVPVRIKILS